MKHIITLNLKHEKTSVMNYWAIIIYSKPKLKNNPNP